jgi:hypothetical protein
MDIHGAVEIGGLQEFDGVLAEQVTELGAVLAPELFAEPLEAFVDGQGLGG